MNIFYDEKKYMGKVYLLLSLLQLVIIIKGMVLHDGFLDLDYLFQKSLRCSHPKENYQMSLRDEIIPTSLEIKQEETFQLATDDFKSK